jgi:hypothetical protein
MAFCSSGRDDPNTLIALGVSHMKKHSVAHADQIDALFYVIFAIIDAFHRERIAEGQDSVVKADPVIAPIGRRLVVVPFKCRRNVTTDYP